MANKDLLEISETSELILNTSDKCSLHAVNGYVLIFIHPKTQQGILLAKTAEISDICYTQRPYLPGTLNPMYAKFYNSLDDLKNDVYLLRYHHREFLKVNMLAKPAMRIYSEPNMCDVLSNTNTYYLDELEYIEN